jgi:MFS family permease
VQDRPDHRSEPKSVFYWLWLVFFLHGMAPGFWMPALTNILKARGLEGWVAMVFVVPPLCALVSPLIGGALADQRIAANRLYAWTSLLGAASLFAAFFTLQGSWNPWWFVVLLGFYSLFSAPAWGLLTTVALTHLSHGERRFPLVRLGATLGWMGGGMMTSFILNSDTSPVAGMASGGVRLLGGLAAFMMPHTPPLGRGTSWKSRLGLDAFKLMKQRDHLVFFSVTALYSIPLTAFYMYAPELLKVLGDQRPTGTMAIAQLTEIVAMLLVGSVMLRFRVKTVLMWSLGLSVVRFGMSAWAGGSGSIYWHLGGIGLHGMCYTFYFITAQVFMDRRVDPGLRGQAQGLLALVTGGVGPLIGAVVCGWLRTHLVADGVHGWMEFWAALATMILICFVIFGVFYRGLPKQSAAS